MTTNMAIGPVLQVGGNQAQMMTNRKIQITNSEGKVKTLSQDEFRKQLIKNADKLEYGEDFEFKSDKKAIAAAATIGTTLAAIAGLGFAVKKGVLKPAQIDKEKDVLLKRLAKKVQNFAYSAGEKINTYTNKAIKAVSEFFNKKPVEAEKAQ